MYSLVYGTLPIVRRVGGLADSMTDANPVTLQAGTATGFVFDNYSPDELASTVERAVALYGQPEVWKQVMATGMSQDWS